MEHFEIACYSALAAAAELGGLSQIANACRQIILDEEKMAETVRKELPRVVREYIHPVSLPQAA